MQTPFRPLARRNSMSNLPSINPETQAKSLTKRMKEIGLEMKLSQAYEGIAAIYGFDNWNKFSAHLKSGQTAHENNDPSDFERIVLGIFPADVPVDISLAVLRSPSFSVYRDVFFRQTNMALFSNGKLDDESSRSIEKLGMIVGAAQPLLLNLPHSQLDEFVLSCKQIALLNRHWEDVSLSLILSVITACADVSKSKNIKLRASLILSNLHLDSLLHIRNDSALSTASKKQLDGYLVNHLGIKDASSVTDKIYENHGFSAMNVLDIVSCLK
jgi:hypothetical protein